MRRGGGGGGVARREEAWEEFDLLIQSGSDGAGSGLLGRRKENCDFLSFLLLLLLQSAFIF